MVRAGAPFPSLPTSIQTLTLFPDWLVQNGASYGFCQPYTAGRCAGYNEEKWHWSYMPLSEPMLTDWWDIFGWDICNFLDNVNFVAVNQVGFMAPAYVSTVNQQCKA